MLTLSDFTDGLWVITRGIDDRRAGARGEFRGTAILRPQAGVLRYGEVGRLRTGDGPVLEARRDYLWRSSGGDIEVLFADGRPFHRFTPQGRARGTDHPCGPDLYRVLYDFTAWPVWTAQWTVTGPAKDYVLTSRYEAVPRQHPSPHDSQRFPKATPPAPTP